jgi:hypothetical protein
LSSSVLLLLPIAEPTSFPIETADIMPIKNSGASISR